MEFRSFEWWDNLDRSFKRVTDRIDNDPDGALDYAVKVFDTEIDITIPEVEGQIKYARDEYKETINKAYWIVRNRRAAEIRQFARMDVMSESSTTVPADAEVETKPIERYNAPLRRVTSTESLKMALNQTTLVSLFKSISDHTPYTEEDIHSLVTTDRFREQIEKLRTLEKGTPEFAA